MNPKKISTPEPMNSEPVNAYGECIECGQCVESCLVLRGGETSIVSELNKTADTGAWNCVNCWKCIEVCPQDVDIYGFMMARRRKEDIPSTMRQSVKNIMGKGCSIYLRGINEIREADGLSPIKLIEKHKVKTLLGGHAQPEV